MLTEEAPAKVNLFLHVTGRRANGYHVLDSLAVFPGAGDTVTAGPSDRLSLRITGPCAAGLLTGGDNLVLRAARALAAEAGIVPRAALVLEKRVPVASGIGGGSADAAATLRLLSRAWGLGDDAPGVVAAQLGADVPVCVAARPAVMRGVGEILLAAPDLPAFGMVLVNPGVAVATPAVFAARQGGFKPPVELPASWPDVLTMAADLARWTNDLEPPAVALCPPISDVLAWLRAQPGCLLARMSGSGATCYGLFADPAVATGLARAAPSGWWAWGGECATPAPIRRPGSVENAVRGFTDGGASA